MSASQVEIDFNYYLSKSMDYSAYWNLFETLVAEGKSTWPEDNDEIIQYTKLNFQRSRRVHKQFIISPELSDIILGLKSPITILAITEPWCGDAAQNLPVFAEIEKKNKLLNLRLVLRDENSDLMNSFLTNGSKSIPKIIVLDGENAIKGTWGPRPQNAQALVMSIKKEGKLSNPEMYIKLQTWYNENANHDLQKEIISLIN
jgi:hypothetical protein